MSDNIKLHKNKRGGKLYPVIGQCGLDKYAHDYLGCPNCHVSRDLRCFLKDCPCEGKAFLFKVQGCEHSYSHQIQGHLSSVRIYMNRPGRSRRIVRDAMERVMKMLKDPDTVKRHRTTKGNIDDEDEGLKDFANVEDLKKDIHLTKCNL